MFGLPQRASARRFWSDHRCTLREALQWVRESRTTGESWLGEALISFPFVRTDNRLFDCGPGFVSCVARKKSGYAELRGRSVPRPRREVSRGRVTAKIGRMAYCCLPSRHG